VYNVYPVLRCNSSGEDKGNFGICLFGRESVLATKLFAGRKIIKTGRIVAVLFVLASLLFCSTNIGMAAPMPTAFTYQGRLIDANYPADGLYDLQFSLFDDAKRRYIRPDTGQYRLRY